MLGNMPQSNVDYLFTHDGWNLCLGVWSDGFYTSATLVVEVAKGEGKVDGDPKNFGPTWKVLTTKQIDYDAGEKLSSSDKVLWVDSFIKDQVNPALLKWAASLNSNTAPAAPKEFWSWLNYQFKYVYKLDKTTLQFQ